MSAGDIAMLLWIGLISFPVAGVLALVMLAAMNFLSGQHSTELTLARLPVFVVCFAVVYSGFHALALADVCSRTGVGC